MTSRFYGLIPAAGAGTRFGGVARKQYQSLAGRPMLYHAIGALLAAPVIDAVFVVLAPDDEVFRSLDWSAFGERLAPLYCGGASRSESVLNGLIAAASEVDPEDWMLVHDAARPCLGRAQLGRLIEEIRNDGDGGLLAVRVADTLKRGNSEDRVTATEHREGLWQAQTPQMFRYGVLLRALQGAPAVTDEAAAVERLGMRPRLIEGRSTNLKVTYPADLELAELILRGGGA